MRFSLILCLLPLNCPYSNMDDLNSSLLPIFVHLCKLLLLILCRNLHIEEGIWTALPLHIPIQCLQRQLHLDKLVAQNHHYIDKTCLYTLIQSLQLWALIKAILQGLFDTLKLPKLLSLRNNAHKA